MDRVVLYDGVCGLCHRAVKWLVRRDGGALRYAPLQGETAAALRRAHPEIPTDLDTIVYLEGGRVHLRAAAFFHLARHLRWPWRWAFALRRLPSWLVDPFYRLVARTRYRTFGRLGQCEVPSVAERAQLLP